jgi:two-component system response regulator YesN
MPKQNNTDFRIAEAVRLIESKFDSDPDFNRLAESLNLSVSRLRHLFKEQTGISFRTYLRQTRMKQAKRLLETSFLSIKEMTKQVGIGDVSHFVRDFKKEFGLSPTEYRKQFRLTQANRQPADKSNKSEQKTGIAATANK